MMQIHARVRSGMTLIELLVVMAILSALAALALMIAPGIANQDNTLKGTADVQAALKIAQGMAGAARQPRGVRVIAPVSGAPQPLYIATELQYIESPPVIVADPLTLVPKASPGDTTGLAGPQVRFTYTVGTGGVITNRQCFITGLNADQSPQVVAGATLVLPTINVYTQITSYSSATGVATLSVYPDAALGAGTSFLTYHFGIYAPARPLLGEPTVELPRNIGVDLSLCSPAVQPTSGPPYQNYDIVFAPSGQRLPTASVPGTSQVFLWVRDYTKLAVMPSATGPALAAGFLQGGEQQIVSVRGAAIGAAPALWPDTTTGLYSSGQNQYTFARQKLTGQ